MGFRLIAITPPYFYPGEADRIAEALASRFDRVHIRKPGSTAEDFERLLAAIPPRLLPRISIHDHFQVAAKYGVGGVHLNRRNPATPDGWDGILSVSTHDPSVARQAIGHGCSYVFLSPVFPSFSKPGYGPTQPIAELKTGIGGSVYALGGVTFESLPELEAAGFGGAAMLTEAWRRPVPMDAFRLQLITHPRPGLGVAEGARLALEGGCRWIQLRHKDAPEHTLMEEGRAIAGMCRDYGAVFIVDDHVELVKRLGADGVHLGKNDMSVADARRILGPQYIIGATANTFEDFEAAARAGADYAGVGPFRFTTTKERLAPVLGLDGYRDISRRRDADGIRIPIVAIGGITDADIPAIISAGPEGIAASGSILGAADPEGATRSLLKKIHYPLSPP